MVLIILIPQAPCGTQDTSLPRRLAVFLRWGAEEEKSQAPLPEGEGRRARAGPGCALPSAAAPRSEPARGSGSLLSGCELAPPGFSEKNQRQEVEGDEGPAPSSASRAAAGGQPARVRLYFKAPRAAGQLGAAGGRGAITFPGVGGRGRGG